MGGWMGSGIVFVAMALAGCAVHVVGVMDPSDPGPAVQSADGHRHRLVLDSGSRPLGALDGHLVEIDGVKLGRRVKVTDWRVLEGRHGMPTWVGPVVAYGVQIGIEDRNSGALYFVDPAAAASIAPHLGQFVLIEGYVDGPHQVKVLYWRALAEDAPPG